MPYDYSIAARVHLTRVPDTVISAYGGRKLNTLVMGHATPDTVVALVSLDEQVKAAGSPGFQITDLLRPFLTQAQARAEYESGTRKVFVAKPGFSWHGAGRGLDINLDSLDFGLPAQKRLARFWEIAQPLGWRPVIDDPDPTRAEAWHFDCMGPWFSTFERLGYSQAAMAATLDIGEFGRYSNARVRLLQAQMHRAGYDVGAIDGLLGRKTVGNLLYEADLPWILPEDARPLGISREEYVQSFVSKWLMPAVKTADAQIAEFIANWDRYPEDQDIILEAVRRLPSRG